MSLIDADTGEVVDRTPALRTSGPMTTIRADHVQAAQRKLDTYDENIEVLRPHLEGTSLTVKDAARRIAGRP